MFSLFTNGNHVRTVGSHYLSLNFLSGIWDGLKLKVQLFEKIKGNFVNLSRLPIAGGKNLDKEKLQWKIPKAETWRIASFNMTAMLFLQSAKDKQQSKV